eukprot:TRINITY_DN773259_c0_g1_i1.p1 TRINITY_DN773259_c0_g1~~TRINITY_DN773259_c0_g1_i1.p1  ORF type:complete len:121 (+),score=29.84 TRINITY_DN773259_c0_g1_i1:58-420(+)
MDFEDPKKKLESYLEKHRVIELFEDLSACLIHSRPEDPKQFLIDTLKSKEFQKKKFFSKANISTMFDMFDVAKRGYIVPKQFEAAISNMGIKKKVNAPSERIDLEMFLSTVEEILEKESF